MLRLTPELLSRCYALLRETKPFCRWALPSAAQVRFSVLRTYALWADYQLKDGEHHIRASQSRHSRLETLLASMAHEMVHLRLETSGCRDRSDHGPHFRRLARQVCKHHPMFDSHNF